MLRSDRQRFSVRILVLALVACVWPLGGFSAAPAAASENWVGTWGAAQYVAAGQDALPEEFKSNVTIRQFVRVSIGGSSLRLRVSNAFGTEPIRILGVHLARPVDFPSPRIDAGSGRMVRFNERTDVIVPAGAELSSDPISFAVEPLSILAITIQIEAIPAQQTGHPGSRTTSYVAANAPVNAPELKDARAIDRWYFVSAIDVLSRGGAAVAVIGDSITDGRGSTTNGNDRWTDVLAERLQRSAKHRHIGVINIGIGGNRLLLDGNGPNALARFDRDVLARSGVKYLIVLEGVNDLGMLTRDAAASEEQHDELVRRMTQAYGEMIARARTHGIKIIGATIMPFSGFEYYHPDESNERDRQRVNAWIRTPGHFDAVVDLDKVTADPKRPDWLLPKYDSGDHIHPSPAGFRAMGEAVPLELFGP